MPTRRLMNASCVSATLSSFLVVGSRSGRLARWRRPARRYDGRAKWGRTMKLGRRAALGGLAMAGVAGPGRAQAWPAKTVTWVVPLAAGGVNDTFARPLAAHV